MCGVVDCRKNQSKNQIIACKCQRAMFRHFGILHLCVNMWALFQCGPLVERLQGRLLYGITYLTSGVGGGLLSLGWHGDKIWTAGASGAIFGIYGALLGHLAKERQAVPKAVFQPLISGAGATAPRYKTTPNPSNCCVERIVAHHLLCRSPADAPRLGEFP